jgi:pre-mRNA-processing factor 17
MSLPISYSSDEDDVMSSVKTDAFGLSALPVAKKARVDETQVVSADAAPHVLAEVSCILIDLMYSAHMNSRIR